MSARAPSAIYNLWYAIHRDIASSQLGGIVGDQAHGFGYHLARRDLPAADYSVQLAKDKLGASDCASALDVTLSPELMITCTRRLVDAAKLRDPRLACLREFAGTLDGRTVYAWDLSSNTRSYGWDDSHLWHIHLSFYREYADNDAALAPIADVFTGKPLKYPPDSPHWSDTVTKEEVQQLIRQEIEDALHSTMQGGDHGYFTRQRFPILVKATNQGILDRLYEIEQTEAKP